MKRRSTGGRLVQQLGGGFDQWGLLSPLKPWVFSGGGGGEKRVQARSLVCVPPPARLLAILGDLLAATAPLRNLRARRLQRRRGAQ